MEARKSPSRPAGNIMDIVVVNCSPRPRGNTAQLLDQAIEGIHSLGADAVRVNYYHLQALGCHSCFSCKRLDSPSFGRCAWDDSLKPVLDMIIDDADALLIGSPIYYKCVSSGMRAFLERLVFPLHDYSPERASLLGRKIPVGCIYTMNATSAALERGYEAGWSQIRTLCEDFIGPYQELVVTDTLQFSDYSAYASKVFDPEHKRKVHEGQFPHDLECAYELGRSVTEAAAALKAQ